MSGVECPFCGSYETEILSLFGQQLMTVQYYCNHCRTPFERVRGNDVLADARAKIELDSDGRTTGSD